MAQFQELEPAEARGSKSVTSNGSTSPPWQKRQRAKQACEPCRLRKRRCDGSVPCDMCTQFEYQCFYEKHPRKRSKLVEQHKIPESSITKASLIGTEPPSEPLPTTEDLSKLRSMEANSGIAFMRLLGMRLDPSFGPQLLTFGWNLGAAAMLPPTAPSITELLEQDQMHSLALLYFANIHPLYGFLDRDRVMESVSLRWSDPKSCAIPDHLLCGIAALGILFSKGALLPSLPRLVEAQKQMLVTTSTMRPPALVDVQSWILHCLYLRSSDHPHAVWMATCSTMHLIEALGLQLEASSSILHHAVNDGSQDPEIRRRTFWVARMLNSWVSFEYGRSRVAIHGITARLPTSKEGDYTTDFVNLYSISCCLDPETVSEKQSPYGQWEDFLTKIEAYEPPHDGIALSKANLGLCGYRRLRLANPNLSNEIIKKIIKIGLGGLGAARRMAEKGLPWWHVANVPFQTVCVFLSMDVRESLSHIATAMRTLEFVAERFESGSMKDALKTARFLVRLSKKKKDEDSQVLGQSLKKAMLESDLEVENPTQTQTQTNGGAPPTPLTGSSTSMPSVDDWNLDVLGNSDFDWNVFLTADMPVFSGFAPDGTM